MAKVSTTLIKNLADGITKLKIIVLDMASRTLIVVLPTIGYFVLCFTEHSRGRYYPNQPPLLRILLIAATIYFMIQFGIMRRYIITTRDSGHPRQTLLRYLGWPTVCMAVVFAYVWHLSAWSHLYLIFGLLLCGISYIHSTEDYRIIRGLSGGFRYLWLILVSVWWIGIVFYLKFIIPIIMACEINRYWHHHRWY